jgi:hypothetical protein
LSWTAGSGATSYNLYRAAESGYESPIAPVVTGITGTSYTNTGLNSGTTYYYQVGAGTAMKKKTVIALARQLAIDLWRWRTGRCTLAELGWVPA